MKDLTLVKFIIILSIFFSFNLNAQIEDYMLSMQEVTIDGLPGVQSFAIGHSNGKWLIVGGRLDGLHPPQVFASFPESLNNKNLIVLDPITKEVWLEPLTSLSLNLQEQLSSTNPNFYQNGNILYFIGGYGYSQTARDHVTFDNLAAIDVERIVNAIINDEAIDSYIRQISDPQFAVTGGHLEKIYETYYLTGGHRFDGRYNPLNNPTFTQTYTNQVRRFLIEDDGIDLLITHLEAYTDSDNLHRRDYKV